MKLTRLIICTLSLGSVLFGNAGTPASKTAEEQHYLDELYKCMNPADKADRTEEFYLENAIRPALIARKEMPWGAIIPEREWLHFVMPLRVNNEAIDAHRPAFYSELKERIKNLDMKSAILEINHWCHEKATYQPSDGRTHSPLQTVSSAIGRCGEESTFAVATLRAMGIPARQVYTPRWAHTDDNHAWVEAWADGQWYFLGACEPEPVLNLGWFNAPAARGMLMHARVPGSHYDGPEEILARMNGNTDINVTSNYAPVDTLKVTIVNPDGTPAIGAEVTFRIYNYAEFYPLVTKKADKNGQSSIIAGLGDMLVWATSPDGSAFGFSKASIGKTKHLSVTLDKNSRTTAHFDLDIVPPMQRDASVIVTDEARRINDRRMATEDSIRNCYTATFATQKYATDLANLIGADADFVWDILKKSRGNHSTITTFLKGVDPKMKSKALQLLNSLSFKDLTDVTLDVLTDHMTARENGGDLFEFYVLSPRIDYEELTPFRSFFKGVISDEESAHYRENPQEWVNWVADNIDTSLDWYPEQATMSPKAVWNSRKTSDHSRDIFFVAAARYMGIPSRIDPVTMKTQWADNQGNWHDAVFDKTSETKNLTTDKGTLQLPLASGSGVEDPKYYSHFTISKITNGRPQLQNYPENIALSESFANPETLDAGQYMIVTGQRMADGSVLSHVDIINLEPGENAVDTLLVRQDPSGIQVVGSFNSESLFQLDGAESPQSLLSATGRGYYVLGLLKPNHEPSNHALRDLSAEKSALETWGRPIVLLYEDSESAARADNSEMPALPSTAITGTDINSDILNQVKEIPGIKTSELPIIIIADTFNRVVYVSQGYTIGLGQRIADIARRLD